MSEGPKLCKMCKTAPASTGTRGISGSAMLAGMCYPCWKRLHRPAAAAKDAAAEARPFDAVLSTLDACLDGMRALAADTDEIRTDLEAQLRDASLAELEASAEQKAAGLEARIRDEAHRFAEAKKRTRKATVYGTR